MKYKVGDRVKIKSLDWYNENSNDDYNVVFADGWHFSKPMSIFCGKELIIENISHTTNLPHYMMKDNVFGWTDEMIEGLVEEENKPKFKVGDEVRIKGTDIGGTIESVIRGQLIVNSKGSKIPAWPEDVVLMKSVEEETKPNAIEEAKTYWDSIKDAWICPEGYIFKDENGNVINTTKIVLEKKKKEYPKTYEECCKILDWNHRDYDRVGYKSDLLCKLQVLLLCRDAYWKIASEEIGLGKPWKPDWKNSEERSYCIVNIEGDINLPEKILTKWILKVTNKILVFPTSEMQDAFYENFKEEIEICKELL